MLKLSLFRIPITVRGSFLVIAALLGFSGLRDPVFIAAWVAIVFVSILIHEFGHAFTARSLGAEVAIELNGIETLTDSIRTRSASRSMRRGISAETADLRSSYMGARLRLFGCAQQVWSFLRKLLSLRRASACANMGPC